MEGLAEMSRSCSIALFGLRRRMSRWRNYNRRIIDSRLRLHKEETRVFAGAAAPAAPFCGNTG